MLTFAKTETQAMLAEMAERLLTDRNQFELRRHRLSGAVPDRMAVWPDIVEQGLIGAAFCEAKGGYGGSMRDMAVVTAAAGRHLLVEPMIAVAAAGQVLAAAGHPVDGVIAGERIVVLAHDEELDPFAPRTVVAEPNGKGWTLRGTKALVRHGDLAHAFVVTAQLADQTACFLVEADAAGVICEPTRLIDGASGAMIRFDNTSAVRLEADPDRALGGLACLLAVESVAICEQLNHQTSEYLKTRKQFGTPLAAFQALQHRAADMHAATELAAALTDMAIDLMDTQGNPVPAFAALALANDAGRLVGHEAVQLHGGMGVSDELSISHGMRRLAAIRAAFGSSAALRRHIADHDIAATAVDAEANLAGFRAEVREFVKAALPADIRRKGEHDLEFGKSDFVRWQKLLRDQGWFAGAWPEAMGGEGWGLSRQLAFARETGRAGAPMIIPYGVNMVGPVIYTFGNADQQALHLPGILSNEVWWCQGYSEPNAGSDLASLKTTAIRDGDHYIVNGTKMWTTEAHWADWMHCLVRTDQEGRPQQGISFLLIDMTTPGIEVRPIVTIDGQHHTNQVFFDDVRVPVDNLVGQEGQGWAIAKFLLANERVAIADTGPKLRLLARLHGMLADVRTRQGDTPLVVGLADRLCATEVELAALCAYEQACVDRWQDGGAREGPEASILKIRGTEILQALSEIALDMEGPLAAVHDPNHLHVPEGRALSAFEEASTLGHHYLYGRCWSIFGGTNEIQRNIISRFILG